MTQNEIADMLVTEGFQAFAADIRSATGMRALADGTTETHYSRAIREALTQIERDYIPGTMNADADGRYQRAIAALRSAEV